MLRKACKGLVAITGYLCYALVLLVLLLWLLLPKEAVKRSLVQYLNGTYPQLRWQVQSLNLHISEGVTLRGIEGYEVQDTKRPQVRVDFLTLRPDIAASLKTKRLQVEYRMVVAQGVIAGTVQWDGWNKGLEFKGSMQGVQLAECAVLSRKLERDLQGTASGTFRGTVLATSGAGEMEANLSVDHGRLGLKRPVLNQRFLPFVRATVALSGRGGVLQLEQGAVDSELFNAQFSGAIMVNRNFVMSLLDIRGTMQPRPALFKDVDNPSILKVIRTQLKDSNVVFRVSGDLYNPGIYFEEFTQLFQSLETESK